MSDYSVHWRVNLLLRYEYEYLLSISENEEERKKLKRVIDDATREADACKDKHLHSMGNRARDWERKRMYDEESRIKEEAMAKAIEKLKKGNGPLLIRNNIWYLVGDKHFVIRDNNKQRPIKTIDYERLEVSGSSSSSGSGFIGIQAQSIDEIRIVIQPEEKVLQFERQQYEDEFDLFLVKLQQKVYEATSR